MTIPSVTEKCQSRQLDLFFDHLPAKPYCTDYLPAGLVIRQKKLAIEKLYIQANGPTHVYWLPFDIDDDNGIIGWQDKRVPAPNIVVGNPENGHAHYLIGLAVPVRKAPDAQLKPLKYAAAVEYGLMKLYGADPGYSGLIVKNPLHDHWIVQTWQENLYTLGWLADYVDKKIDCRQRSMDYGLGRNVTVFDLTRRWAYREILKYKNESYEVWFKACYERAAENNTFACPLPLNEIKATAKSIAKWVYGRDFSNERFSAIQAHRGRNSGIKRAITAAEKLRIIDAQGDLPVSVIAALTGIPISTIYWLKSKRRQFELF